MRVLVLGAGLLGVTSAYYLQQLGHEVTVVDRHSMPAAKARGLADAPGSEAPPIPQTATASPPWAGEKLIKAGDGVRRRIAKLFDRALGMPPKSRPLENMVRLGAYSRQSVRALRDEAGVPQSPRGAGLLNVYTDSEAFRLRTTTAPHWRGLGCDERLLSPEEAVGIEPALQAVCAKLTGATYAPEDPARDPAHFAASMVFMCRAAGVKFLTNHTVLSLQTDEGRIHHVEVRDEQGRQTSLRAQAYVLALGTASVAHAERLKIAMPVRVGCEYIVTMPVKDVARAPRVALHDRQGKLRITRVETPNGDRLHARGTVRVSLDAQEEPDSDRFTAILERIETLLPGAGDTANASLETTIHAESVSGLPMIGKTHLPNLFLNTAPGAPGWVNACGAGKSIARIVSGLRPELDFAFHGL